MLDIYKLTNEELKLFNEILEEVLRDASCQIPLTILADRFSKAINAGVRDTATMKAIIRGGGTSPGGLGLTSSKRTP